VKALDRFLQSWRIAKALPHVRHGDRLLDVGCADRSLIDSVLDRVDLAVGIDPLVEPLIEHTTAPGSEPPAEPARSRRVELVRGRFPQDAPFERGSFDCVTALAVLEHVDDPRRFAEACARILAPGGRVVLTVPHRFVDRILDALIALRVADGMAAEEHHGFDLEEARRAFEAAGFRLEVEERFQLGLNRVFVFQRTSTHNGRISSPDPSQASSTGAKR